MRSRTSLSAGSWNGVKVPLRASISQAIASSEDGENARKAPEQGVERAAPLFPVYRPAARLGSLRSIAPCERPFGDQEINPIGGKTEKRHRQHDRVHPS